MDIENYVNYEYYKNNYRGSLSADLFNKLLPKTFKYLEANVNKKIDEKDLENDRVKFVLCELIDNYNEGEQAKNGSYSIDGVSVSKNSMTDIEKERGRILGRLPQYLVRYL